jgi:serine/threonine protein kinase
LVSGAAGAYLSPSPSANVAIDVSATVAGGAANVAWGNFSTVAGGWANTASGAFSFVGGGLLNTAAGVSSVTLGSHGAASHERSGVFGFSGEPCASAGAGTARFCAAEVYVNDVALLNSLNDLTTTVFNLSGTVAEQSANDTAQLDAHEALLATQAVQISTLQAEVTALKTTTANQATAFDAQVTVVAAQASELANLTATAAGQAYELAAQADELAAQATQLAAQATQLDVQAGQISELYALVLDLTDSTSATTAPASFTTAPLSSPSVSSAPCDDAGDDDADGADCLPTAAATTAVAVAVAVSPTSTTAAAAAGNSTADQDHLVLAGAIVAAAVVAAAVVVAAVTATAVCIRQRSMRAGKHVVHAIPLIAAASHKASHHKAVHIAVETNDDGGGDDGGGGGAGGGGTGALEPARVLVAQMRPHLQSDAPSWASLEKLAQLLGVLGPVNGAQQLTEPEQAIAAQALAAVQAACDAYQLQLDAAVAAREFDKAKLFNTRLSALSAAALPAAADGAPAAAALSPRVLSHPFSGSNSSQLECVADGLLLSKGRFDGGSSAFLGRGASGAVSRGLLVEVVGSSHEQRTAVAVKEVPKTGAASEQRAVHELVIVTEKLGRHPNVVQTMTVKSTGSTFYIVMELCQFSLDKQPEAFQELLHAPDSAAGALVLNALVQDLVRGVAFLHAKHVFHCDLKPANVLVALDRAGKRHQQQQQFKPKYFKLAQLKLADFGVSRVVRPKASASSAATGEGEGEGWGSTTTTCTTATVSLDGLQASQGIAGTEAYMCPELLQILRDLRAGKLDAEPEVDDVLLARNDSFGCGCVVAFLCSRGRHPFEQALFRSSLPDNILAHRRTDLRKLGIKDPRHLELVAKLTAVAPAGDRWTAAHAHASSRIFDAAALMTTSVHGGSGAADIMLDQIELHRKPRGTCREQLLSPQLVAAYPLLPAMLEQMEVTVRQLQKANARALPVKLDEDSCVWCFNRRLLCALAL